jgi:hypothetical protein
MRERALASYLDFVFGVNVDWDEAGVVGKSGDNKELIMDTE